MKHNGLTTTQFADLLVISSQTVINWIEAGKLKCRRIGKGPRIISYAEAMRFIRENNIDPNTLNLKLYTKLMQGCSSSPTLINDPMLEPAVSIVTTESALKSILVNVNGEQKSVPIENPQGIKTGFIRIQINQDFTKATIV